MEKVNISLYNGYMSNVPRAIIRRRTLRIDMQNLRINGEKGARKR